MRLRSRDARAFAAVGPDTVAKYLFTSGSTGMPKGVVNTQRMLCVNPQMTGQQYPVLFEEPPVLVDWMPWNHTFGGNYCIHLTLKTGGTMYIDEGRPTPEHIGTTIENLREVAPTVHFNVPAGFALLRAAMEADSAFRDRFFSRLAYVKYAGAALPGDLWDGLQALAVAATGRRVVIVSGYGSTESAPSFTATHWPCEENGNIGIPLPAAECKLVPVGTPGDDRYEIRGRGPGITPGYLGRPNLTAAAFDEEGFFRFGDAVRFVDPAEPARGLLFAGRLTEAFKLDTGTWVNAGALRPEIVSAAAPLLRDAVICGQDRPYAAILAWPDLAACRAVAGDPAAEAEALAAHPAVRARLAEALAAHNRTAGGSSRRIRRALLMAEPPQVDGNEITDKGYINQRAAIERRAALVARLYAEPPGADVIVVP